MSDKTTRTRLLSNRGIGKKYHNMSLTDYPHERAAEVIKWIETDSKNSMILGNGLLFFGETQEGYDISVLAARALILIGTNKLHCVSFNLATEQEFINHLWEEKPPIVITNFLPDNNFVDPDRYKRLENVLNYYLDNCIPFFLHIPVDVNSQSIEYGNLISPVFLDRLLKNYKTFPVA